MDFAHCWAGESSGVIGVENEVVPRTLGEVAIIVGV